jgi:predicted nucleic acid-binding protein
VRLADTSIWVDYLQAGDAEMAAALNADLVAMHPMVLAELALGNLSEREEFLASLHAMPRAPLATEAELLIGIDARVMHGRGIGYVDAHLVSSCLISGYTLWTRDRRLGELAVALGAC